MDEITTGGGAVVQGDANTRDLTGRDSHQQNSSVTFQNPDSAELWRAIIALGNQISELQAKVNDRVTELAIKMDDLPRRVGKLEVRVEPVPVPVALTPTSWLLIVLIGLFVGTLLFLLGRGF